MQTADVGDEDTSRVPARARKGTLDTMDSRTVSQRGKGALRDRMPEVTAFVDDLRSAFGEQMITGAIRSGVQGRPHFWASENGHEVGTWWPRCGERDEQQSPDA